jgi:dienelactone hydrolase
MTVGLAPGSAASPFPSDLLTVKAGTPTGLRNNVQSESLIFEALVNHNDGWAPNGAIRMHFSSGVTDASLPLTVTASTEAAAAIQLVDTQTWERAPFKIKRGMQPDRIYLIPFRPLLEERRYAIVVRDTLQPIEANCARRNADFAALLRGQKVAGVQEHVARSVREVFAGIRAHEAELGYQAENVLLAVPYTTQSITRELLAKRELVIANPITAFTVKSYPALMTDGSFNPELEAIFPGLPSDLEFGKDAKLDNVSHIVLGYFQSADYRNECEIAWGYYTWEPTVQCDSTLQFLLALPKLSAVRPELRGTIDATGRFPVVVFGHGLTACKETALAVVNTFAEYGLAVVGIDVVEHGTRNFNESTGLPNDPYDGCGETLPGASTSISEGLRIIRGAQPELARDNFRQTALDEIQLLQMLVTEVERNYVADATDASDTLGKLQVEKFGYIGQSLGGIIGTLFVTAEPRISAAVLNVPGGGLGDFVLAIDRDDVGATDPKDMDVLPEGLYMETLAAVQNIIGPADSLYWAPYAAGATSSAFREAVYKNILLQQGQEDEVMPAYLTQNLARAFGTASVTPVLYPTEGLEEVDPPYRGAGPSTLALQQFKVPAIAEDDPCRKAVPKCKDWDAHYMLSMSNDPRVAQAVQHQAAHFLWTGLFEDKAEVIDGYSVLP